MKKINLGFGKYAEANLLILAQAVIAAFTGSPFWPSPTPALAALQTAIDAYSDALTAAADGGKSAIVTKNARKANLIGLLVQLANYAMMTAGDDEEMLGTTAFPLQKQREPLPPMLKPEIVKLEDGVNSGAMSVFIKAVLGGRNFVYQCTPEPLTANSEWTSQNSTLTKCEFTDLEPGKKYWFRVIGYGKNEQEVFSDPVLSQIVR